MYSIREKISFAPILSREKRRRMEIKGEGFEKGGAGKRIFIFIKRLRIKHALYICPSD